MTERTRFHELLERHLAGIAALSPEQSAQLFAHYQRLVRWNKVLNLTAIRDLGVVVRRHYCESIFAGLQIPGERLGVADVGSGAGFPGIPLAVLRPDCMVTLIESHQRKAVFLKECAREITNLVVITSRAEHLDGSFDWIIARAVSPRALLRLVPRLSKRVVLLVGTATVGEIERERRVKWAPPVQIPWSRTSAVVVGEYVSRGTETS